MSIARTRQFEPVSSRPHLSIIGLTSAGGVFASGRWPDGVRDIFADKDFKLSEMVPYCLDLQLDSMPVKEDAQFLDRLYFVSLVPHEQTVQPSLAENWWRCTEYVEHGKGKFEQLAVGKFIDVSGIDTRLKTVRVVHRPLSEIFKEGDRLIYAPGGKGKLWACITNSGHRNQ